MFDGRCAVFAVCVLSVTGCASHGTNFQPMPGGKALHVTDLGNANVLEHTYKLLYPQICDYELKLIPPADSTEPEQFEDIFTNCQAPSGKVLHALSPGFGPDALGGALQSAAFAYGFRELGTGIGDSGDQTTNTTTSAGGSGTGGSAVSKQRQQQQQGQAQFSGGYKKRRYKR